MMIMQYLFYDTKKQAVVRKHNKPHPRVAHHSIARFLELTKNVIRSSHGHSTRSLKISCKSSVQSFSRNLANKETKIQTKKQRNRSKTIPRPRCIGNKTKNTSQNSSLHSTPKSKYFSHNGSYWPLFHWCCLLRTTRTDKRYSYLHVRVTVKRITSQQCTMYKSYSPPTESGMLTSDRPARRL